MCAHGGVQDGVVSVGEGLVLGEASWCPMSVGNSPVSMRCQQGILIDHWDCLWPILGWTAEVVALWPSAIVVLPLKLQLRIVDMDSDLDQKPSSRIGFSYTS